jgi:hypothetical protein
MVAKERCMVCDGDDDEDTDLRLAMEPKEPSLSVASTPCRWSYFAGTWFGLGWFGWLVGIVNLDVSLNAFCHPLLQ